ncbi:MAG: diguanylate cyclase [Spirochaetales bacterium]|nr:diguanylate cyclase [Spirochaetales bacterium]
MKKKPEKRYSPGELERTRKNIGNLSREEAEKMTKILGGDIGEEDDPEDIKNKYLEFQSRHYRKKRFIHAGKRKKKRRHQERIDGTGRPARRRQYRKETDEKGESGDATFIDRVKLDFLCSKPEYRLKPLSGAIASLFSLFIQVPDYVNPMFIKKAHLFFYTALYNFITSIRGLFTKTRPDVMEEVAKHPLYGKVLTVIKKWDITAINLELNILRKYPYRQTVKRLSRLCRYVYEPFAILFDIEPDTHIREAIRWAYNINMSHTPEKGKIQDRIRNFYYEAIKFLPVIFHDIKRMFYPLLLKQMTNRFATYEEFLLNYRSDILGFLNLTEDQVIKPAEGNEPVSTNEETALEDKTPKPGDGEDIGEKPAQSETAGTAVNDGITLLQFLFPGAGWNRLNVYPDLYPYFQPLFRFPSGFELIPRSDPLHQVMILASIIHYLLYGFRNIKFNIVRNERLEAVSVKEKIDSLLSIWPVFVDDVIGDYYVSQLSDYCRHLEKDKKFGKTEVAEKLVNEMNSIKKTFFLPYYRMTFSKIVTGILKKPYPKLYTITEEFTPLLGRLSMEIHQQLKEKREKEKRGEKIKLKDLKCEGILNPWDKYDFGLMNPVSKRLDRLLVQRVRERDGSTKIIDRRTNANIVIYSHTLMAMLNDLVNEKTSYFYNPPDSCLFRSTGDAGTIPQYSVGLLDTEKIMQETPQKNPDKPEVEPNGKKNAIVDPVTGLYGKSALSKEVAREINDVHIHGTYFSLIFLFLPKLQSEIGKKGTSYGNEVSKTCATAIKRIVRRIIDIPFILDRDEYVVLLSKTDILKAISVARRIRNDAAGSIDMVLGSQPIYIGALQYNPKWDLDKTIKILEKVKVVVRNQPAPRIVYLDHAKNTLKAIRL